METICEKRLPIPPFVLAKSIDTKMFKQISPSRLSPCCTISFSHKKTFALQFSESSFCALSCYCERRSTEIWKIFLNDSLIPNIYVKKIQKNFPDFIFQLEIANFIFVPMRFFKRQIIRDFSIFIAS